ncbi:MAG: TolB family protein [Acidimicrobiia bacterium]
MTPVRTPGPYRSGGSRAPGRLLLFMTLGFLLAPSVPAGAGTDGVTTPLPPASRRAGKSFSFRPWVSADGRFVAFDSDSPALVAGDTNRVRDVFVYDRATGTTERVSLADDDTEADGQSQRPTLSTDGRYVAFWSDATNLVTGDTNDVADVFVVDRVDGLVRRVSVGPGGVQANGESVRPVISGDGATVAFESAARNLTPKDVIGRGTDTNAARDIFVHDLANDETTRVSVASDGTQGAGESLRPSMSADGRFVAFQSEAVFDSADTNKARDVFVHDRESGTTTRVSLSGSEAQGDGGSFSPSLSADGRYVAFWSNAANLVGADDNAASDVFVRDLQDGITRRSSVTSDGVEGDGDSSDPSISPDGRWVAYWSAAANLVAGDSNGMRDVFLHDTQTAETIRVSVATDGSEADADCYAPNVGSGGDLVAFDSEATTLVAGDSNPGSDIFLHTG